MRFDGGVGVVGVAEGVGRSVCFGLSVSTADPREDGGRGARVESWYRLTRSSAPPVARVRRWEEGGESARHRIEEVWALTRKASEKVMRPSEGWELFERMTSSLTAAVKPWITRS